MAQQIFFLNMFSDYEPPEELKAAFSQAAIVAADIDPAARSVSMRLSAPRYITMCAQNQVSKDVCEIYGLKRLELNVSYPGSELPRIPQEDLRQLFIRHNPMAMGSLAGAQWNWQGSELTVQLRANGKKELEE